LAAAAGGVIFKKLSRHIREMPPKNSSLIQMTTNLSLEVMYVQHARLPSAGSGKSSQEMNLFEWSRQERETLAFNNVDKEKILDEDFITNHHKRWQKKMRKIRDAEAEITISQLLQTPAGTSFDVYFHFNVMSMCGYSPACVLLLGFCECSTAGRRGHWIP